MFMVYVVRDCFVRNGRIIAFIFFSHSASSVIRRNIRLDLIFLTPSFHQSHYKKLNEKIIIWFMVCIFHTRFYNFMKVSKNQVCMKSLILVYVKLYILAGTVNCGKLTDILSRMCVLYSQG